MEMAWPQAREKMIRVLGGNLVKVVAVGHADFIGKIVLIPAKALQRLAGRQVVGGKKFTSTGDDLCHGGAAVQRNLVEIVAQHQDVKVAVVKAGNHGAALEVNPLAAVGSCRQHFAVAADAHDAIVLNQHGLLKMLALHIDFAVEKYSVHNKLLQILF